MRHAHETLRADREFALRAVQTSATALMYCAEPLRRDTSFLLTAVRAQPEALPHALHELHHAPGKSSADAFRTAAEGACCFAGMPPICDYWAWRFLSNFRREIHD